MCADDWSSEQGPPSQRKRMNKERKATGTQANKERTNANGHRKPADHKRTGSDEMKLAPLHLPGRITRKARDFAADIVQLRAQGYTLEAIRQALDAAGVHVSISTVRREALRSALAVPVKTATSPKGLAFMPPVSVQDATPVAAPAGLVSATAPADWHNGQHVAAAFTRNRITNPLIRAREKR